MEIRERKGPQTNFMRTMPSTIENDISRHLKDYDGEEESVNYSTKVSSKTNEKNFLNDANWNYPMKPAFLTDEDDSDTDSDDKSEDMALMTSCCCCFSTKNGTIAVGIVVLIIAFCISVASCFILINVEDFKALMQTQYNEYVENVANNVTDSRFSLIENLIGGNVIIENLKVIAIGVLVFYAVYTFSALFLTYGACTDLRTLLLPWIVLEFIPFGLQLGGIVIVFIYGKTDPVLSDGGAYIIAGLVQIVGFVVHIYWWMCPVSQYQLLKESSEVEPLVPPSQLLYPNIQKY